MKHYFYTVESIPKKLWIEYVLRVYQIKNNTPVFIDDRGYTSGSYRGHENECLDVLLDIGEITKADYNLSKSSWQGAGYYIPNKKFVIHTLKMCVVSLQL